MPSFCLKVTFNIFLAAIECPALTAPMNGQVSYAMDMTSPYEIGTVATFTCNAGFSLDGANMLTCADDDQLDTVGTWGGTEPTCERKIFFIVNYRAYRITENLCHLQLPVHYSMTLLVEWCPTQCLWSLMVSTQWVQWPPSPVMLALSCLETRQGPVSQTTRGPTVTPLARVSPHA